MRAIRIEDVEAQLPAGWIEQAQSALANVASAPPGQRAKVVNRQNAVWSALKELLRERSCGKCWYCESIDPRSDNAVDHFRPKNRVKEAKDPKNEGYWWLAFDWTNYRFSCTYCNSIRKSMSTTGGKQDRFPLAHEEKRAQKPSDPLDEEEVVLIDPTQPADVVLLTFDRFGNAVPAVDERESPYEYGRAMESIEAYHLNHPDLIKRRLDLMLDTKRRLKRVDELKKKAEKTAYREKLRDLFFAVQREAEFSVAARAAIGDCRGTSGTAEVVWKAAY